MEPFLTFFCTKDAYGPITDSLAFNTAFDVFQDYAVKGGGRSLGEIFSLLGKLGAREQFSLINRLGPAFTNAIATNIGKGILAGFALDASFLTGIVIGAAIEALVGELFNNEPCENEECNAK